MHTTASDFWKDCKPDLLLWCSEPQWPLCAQGTPSWWHGRRKRGRHPKHGLAGDGMEGLPGLTDPAQCPRPWAQPLLAHGAVRTAEALSHGHQVPATGGGRVQTSRPRPTRAPTRLCPRTVTAGPSGALHCLGQASGRFCHPPTEAGRRVRSLCEPARRAGAAPRTSRV